MHDFEHRGKTNDFLVNAYDDLAVTYNDRSPMVGVLLFCERGVLTHSLLAGGLP